MGSEMYIKDRNAANAFLDNYIKSGKLASLEQQLFAQTELSLIHI